MKGCSEQQISKTVLEHFMSKSSDYTVSMRKMTHTYPEHNELSPVLLRFSGFFFSVVGGPQEE